MLKKFMSIVLALIITLSMAISVNAAMSYDGQSSTISGMRSPVKGDIDGDGKISAADARLVLRMSVGLENIIRSADVDGDGKVSAADARLVLRVSVGLETFENENSYFEVHFLDVGQADCSLIICDDETLLIDGGNVADSEYVVSYLSEVGVKELDYVICTHAHEDHVGGLVGPLTAFTVTETVYAPATGATTKCYKNFVAAVQKQNKTIVTPVFGEILRLGTAEVQFICPTTDKNYEDINNTSLVVKIVYGETSFLFTGDAERELELDILETDFDLSADVLKVGHHGSDSSTTYPFLREVMPEIAIISVGEDNTYGHPTEGTLSKLNDADVTTYRTDINGDIVVTSDGENIDVRAKKFIVKKEVAKELCCPIVYYPETGLVETTVEEITVESPEIPVEETTEEIFYIGPIYPDLYVGVPPTQEPVETMTIEEEIKFSGWIYPTLHTGVPPIIEEPATVLISEAA